ncbi:MAG: DUF47 family protein [Burkholderiaceae bacterium]|jgi:predicted phosphate transport protein (TIGR00153 family)|nr:DUF47 family protein [Burkholderiaceae bacterium]
MLFSKLLPKSGNFFELFNQHAAHISEAAAAFSDLVGHYGDPRLSQQYSQAVDRAEAAADLVTGQVNRLIHTTFITPIDREQIHELVNRMDDVVDLLQNLAETLALYEMARLTDEMRSLTDLSVRCCNRLAHAVGLLGRISEQASADDALKTCAEIAQLEADADRVMRGAIGQLFRQQPDVRELIKQKEVYELLETVTDKCKAVANQIEGIVLENA